MATPLPVRTIFDGTGIPTTSAMKAALGSLRDYLAEQFGTTGGAPTGMTSVNGHGFDYVQRLINSGFTEDQRNSGAAQTITAAAALAYTVDRWYAYCTGANVSGQRVAGSAQSQYRYQFTGAASVTGIGFGTRLEAVSTYDLNSQTATFSVDLANSLLTTVTWTAYYANSADTFGTLAAPTRTLIASGSFTVTSTVTRYSTQISIPAAATTGIEVVLSVGAQISGTWTIGRPMLTLGSTQENWVPYSGLFGGEKQACERYYWQTVGAASNITTIGTGVIESAGTTAVVSWRVPVTMRVTPTLLSSGTLQIYDGVALSSLSSVTNNSSTPDVQTLTYALATTLTGGRGAILIVRTGALVTHSAEL